MKTNVTVLIGEFIFPADFASSTRVLGIAKAIKECGGYPIIVGRVNGKNDTGVFDGIDFEDLNSENKGRSRFHSKSTEYASKLTEINNQVGVSNVILYASSSYKFISVVRNWCDNNNARFMIDVSEYYSARQFKNGFLSIQYHWFTYSFRHQFKKADFAFTCSDVASAYFKKRGLNTITINAVMDIKHTVDVTNSKDFLKIVYAGDAGKKDNLELFIKALTKLSDDEIKRVRLYLIGPSKETIAKMGSNIEDFSRVLPILNVTGRLSRNEVLNQLQTSDATILLRPNLRYSRFGFPSKVAESLCVGVPVFGNLTSDMGKYVRDGQTGFIVEELTVESIGKTLVKFLNCSSEQLISMKQSCLLASEDLSYVNLSKRSDFAREILHVKG